MMKVCSRCGEEKPLDKFPLRRALRADGSRPYATVCKQCRSEESKAYYHARKAKQALLEAEKVDKKIEVTLSMREVARMANQAFPLLSPAYWNTGAAKRVYEELGLKWTF
jgi:hypothetical protein